MDLYDQWVYMEKTTQWRFTPPTHVVAALDSAITQYLEEGGLPARGGRYARNCKALVDGMAQLGFRPFLDPAIQAPIIVTFHAPADPAYEFKTFYQEVKKRGYILYPGKLTQLETFRVGCMGHFGDAGIPGAVAAVADALKSMGVRQVSAAEIA
jgi:2-aminoethylphosphonate-pyruvate transaminase